MIDLILSQFAATLKDIREIVADIPEARMAEQPSGIRNHPIWTLGHLCTAAGFIVQLLGETPVAGHADDVARFGPGSKPVADRAAYPSKAELLAQLATLHEQATRVTRAKHADWFGRPSPESLRSFAPTIGQIVVYLLASHESYHLGQLAPWRRAAGLAE